MEHTQNAKVIVLIPAYKPDDRLIELTRELRGQCAVEKRSHHLL